MSSHIVYNCIIYPMLYIFFCILKSPTVVLLLKEVQHIGEDPPGSTTENVVQLQLERVLVPCLKQVVSFFRFSACFFAKFCHIHRFRIVILSVIWVSNFQIDFIGSTSNPNSWLKIMPLTWKASIISLTSWYTCSSSTSSSRESETQILTWLALYFIYWPYILFVGLIIFMLALYFTCWPYISYVGLICCFS